MRSSFCLCLLLILSTGTTLRAQNQWPAREEARILPHLEELVPLPALGGPRSTDWNSRPVWYLPLGTVFRLRDERLILPHTTRYSIGVDEVMANQFLHLPAAPHARVIPKDSVWQLAALGGVHGRTIYAPHLLRPRHTIYMRLESPAGETLELEVCPGSNCLPSVGQFSCYFEITPPAAEAVPPGDVQ